MANEVLGHVLMWTLIVIISPLLFLLALYKFIVIGIAFIFYPSLRIISFKDVIVTVDSSDNTPNINTTQIWILKGQLSVDEFRIHFTNCFLSCARDRINYGNFYCYIVNFLGHTFKKRVDEIDLKYHIQSYALGVGESVEGFVGKWMLTNTYGFGKPLWQVVIIDNKENKTTAVILKMHHSLVDGYSFVHIVEKLSGEKAPYLVKNEEISLKSKIKIISKAPKLVLDTWRDMAFSKNSRNPFIIDRKENPAEWFISFSTLDLNAVKRIRRRTGTHFVCVMMAIEYGALRRLLLETVKKEECLPEFLWIANSLPWPNHPKGTLSNHWTCGFFKVPLRLSNSLIRLKKLEESYLDFVNKDKHKIAILFQMPLVWLLPVRLIRALQNHDLALVNSSLTFASLVCSSEKHFLLGREVQNLYLPVIVKDITPHCALYAVTTTVGNKLELSVNASSKLVAKQEDLNRLTRQYFQEELHSLDESSKLLEHQNNSNDDVLSSLCR